MTRIRMAGMLTGTALGAILIAAVHDDARAETTGGGGESAYGCSNLEDIAELQMIEGKDGMFSASSRIFACNTPSPTRRSTISPKWRRRWRRMAPR